MVFQVRPLCSILPQELRDILAVAVLVPVLVVVVQVVQLVAPTAELLTHGPSTVFHTQAAVVVVVVVPVVVAVLALQMVLEQATLPQMVLDQAAAPTTTFRVHNLVVQVELE
jgi:hypothetical protein